MKMVKIGLASAVQPSFWGSSKDLFRKTHVPAMEKLAAEQKFELAVWPNDIISEEDAAQAVAFMNAENVDFVLLQCTTFPGGNVILPFEGLRARLGLWAMPESSREGPIPLNSFCGVNMLASILGQYVDASVKAKWFYGTVDSPLFLERFGVTLRALRGLKRLNGAKIGLVGGIAPGFTDFAFDERKTKRKLGVSVDRLPEFGDIKERALGYSADVIAPLVLDFMGEAQHTSESVRAAMENTARVYKAFEDLILENGYDALAVGCWPRYRKELGIVVCSVIGRLLDKGYIAACEGDVDSAGSMLLLGGIASDIPMLMDLSDVDFEDDSALLWHCGSAPKRYAGKSGLTLDAHYKPGQFAPGADDVPVGTVNEMVFAENSVTVARFTWEYEKALLMRGEVFDKADKGYDGSRGWMRNMHMAGQPVGTKELVNTLMVSRFQHHYPLVAGNFENEVMECLNWLDITPIEPVPYKPYLQNF